MYNSNTNGNGTNDNIDDRMTKFATQLQNKFVYRMPLEVFLPPGKNQLPCQNRHENKMYVRNRNEKTVRVQQKGNSNGNARCANCLCQSALYKV